MKHAYTLKSLLLLLSYLMCACSTGSFEKEDLTGTWVTYKIINYMQGKETVATLKEGSKPNLAFTKYSEIVFGGYNGNADRAYSFSIKGDSITIDQENFSPRAMSIDKLTPDSLQLTYEMKIPYIDPSLRNGKWIVKEYYYKKK